MEQLNKIIIDINGTEWNQAGNMNGEVQHYIIRNAWIYIVKYLIVKMYGYHDIEEGLTWIGNW